MCTVINTMTATTDCGTYTPRDRESLDNLLRRLGQAQSYETFTETYFDNYETLELARRGEWVATRDGELPPSFDSDVTDIGKLRVVRFQFRDSECQLDLVEYQCYGDDASGTVWVHVHIPRSAATEDLVPSNNRGAEFMLIHGGIVLPGMHPAAPRYDTWPTVLEHAHLWAQINQAEGNADSAINRALQHALECLMANDNFVTALTELDSLESGDATALDKRGLALLYGLFAVAGKHGGDAHNLLSDLSSRLLRVSL